MVQLIRGRVPACMLLTGLVAGACAATPPSDATPEAVIVAPAAECSAFAESRAPVVFYGMDPTMPAYEPAGRIAAAAGATISINIGQYYGPSGIRPVSRHCIEWQVEPAGAASVRDDGANLTLSADAAPGSVISLTGVIAGAEGRSVSGTVRINILDEASRQLIGTWSFEDVRGCDRMSVDPPREIRFEPENGMSVAWTVFERYWDYWGRYAWAPESGAFSFETTGGNRVPSDVSGSGQLVVEDARHLALSGFHFGNRDPDTPSALVSAAEAGCTLVFRRQRGGAQ